MDYDEKENAWLKSELEIKEKAISVLEGACEENIKLRHLANEGEIRKLEISMLQKQLDEATKFIMYIRTELSCFRNIISAPQMDGSHYRKGNKTIEELMKEIKQFQLKEYKNA